MIGLAMPAEDAPASGDDLAREVRRRVVEDQEVDVVAMEGGAELRDQPDARLEPLRAGRVRRSVEQRADVDIALAMRPAARDTAEEIRRQDAGGVVKDTLQDVVERKRWRSHRQ
jgi:hypothetical protein